MEFRLYIDGIDAYVAYHLSVSESGYNDFACFPKLKPVASNDWHERNGIDPDLSSPVLDAREVTLRCHIIGGMWRYYKLIESISDGAYHLFNLAEIGLKKRLRLVKCGDVKSTRDMHSFSLTFSDDFPLEDYEPYGPVSGLMPRYDYMIDGKDISCYGIRMLDGTLDSIVRQPDVKENLKVSLSHMSGVMYDGEGVDLPNGNVTFKSKTVSLRCFMRGRSLKEFWHNWNTLLYDLTKPNERMLSVKSLNKDIPFFYKDCSVDAFFPDHDKVWLEFTLNVEFFKGVI